MEAVDLVVGTVSAAAAVVGTYFSWLMVRAMRHRSTASPAAAPASTRSAARAIGIVGAIASIGTYFAWRAVQSKRHHSATAPADTPTLGGDMTTYDVFISYTHADAALVKDLAFRLRRRGIEVAFDELLLPGTPLVHGVEQMILNSANGLLVYSRASLLSRWVTNEYYALIQKSIETGQLFIPVLIDGTQTSDLPLFAQTRYHPDLHNVTDEEFDQHVEKIVEALRQATR